MFVRSSRGLVLLGTFDTQKHCTGRQTRLEVTSGPPGSPRPRLGVTSGSLRGHFAVTGPAQNSARDHVGATSGSPGSPRTRVGVTSGSLRDHLARENSARGHFGVTWLKKTRLGVTSRSLGSGKLGSKSLRSHSARENLARSHFGAASLGSGSLRGHFGITWLEKTRLEVTSGSLGSRKLGSESLRGHTTRENSG